MSLSQRGRKIAAIAMVYATWPLIAATGYLFAPLTSPPPPSVERAALAHDFLSSWLVISLLITSAGVACAVGCRLRAVSVWASVAALAVVAAVAASYLWRPWASDYLMGVTVCAVGGLAAALIVPAKGKFRSAEAGQPPEGHRPG